MNATLVRITGLHRIAHLEKAGSAHKYGCVMIHHSDAVSAPAMRRAVNVAAAAPDVMHHVGDGRMSLGLESMLEHPTVKRLVKAMDSGDGSSKYRFEPGEVCPHCGAIHEEDTYTGQCNSCGKKRGGKDVPPKWLMKSLRSDPTAAPISLKTGLRLNRSHSHTAILPRYVVIVNLAKAYAPIADNSFVPDAHDGVPTTDVGRLGLDPGLDAGSLFGDQFSSISKSFDWSNLTIIIKGLVEDGKEHWVTINGRHTLIGEDGKPVSGNPFAHPKLGHETSTPEQRSVAKERGVTVPPASWGLRVAESPGDKVQAKFFDRKGKQQSLYHPSHTADSKEKKFGEDLPHFTKVLPAIRETVDRDLKRSGKDPRRACAAIVKIMDMTGARIGSEKYAVENGTYGASSLRKGHVSVDGDTVTLKFVGKHHKEHSKSMTDAPLAAAIREFKTGDIDGLFGSVDDDSDGRLFSVKESRVNAYLGVFGAHNHQFRHFHGTRIAREYLESHPETDAKQKDKRIKEAAVAASEFLGNDAAEARKSYIHPDVLTKYANE